MLDVVHSHLQRALDFITLRGCILLDNCAVPKAPHAVERAYVEKHFDFANDDRTLLVVVVRN